MNQPLRLEYVDPKTLGLNPANWRTHSPDQVATAEALIFGRDGKGPEVGWADAVRYNARTGRLVDGHMRVSLAASRGESWVPVLIGDWSEEQERKILATLDALGMMADADSRQLADLHKLLDVASPEVQGLLDAVAVAAAQLTTEDTRGPVNDLVANAEGGESEALPSAEKPEPEPTDTSVPDAIWPSDNPWDVPTLDLTLQGNAVDFPVTTWGTIAHTRAMRGTYHFYTADKRFDPLWSNPGKVLLSGCPSVVEPNFSTHEQTPFTVSLWAIFRKRWLARYWQSRGIRVFVDINVHHSLLEPHEAVNGQVPIFLGVPKGWRAFATRSHGGDSACGFLGREHAAAQKHSGAESLLFLVVGGGKAVKQLCGERGWVWVPESSESARSGKDR